MSTLYVGHAVTRSATGLRFAQILMTVAQDMRSALQRARLESDHSLTIGEQTEAALRAGLRRRLGAGHFGSSFLKSIVVEPLSWSRAARDGGSKRRSLAYSPVFLGVF